MTFSIVIPTYNRKWSLYRALLSLQVQTYTDFEAVVVDDCSDPELCAAQTTRWLDDRFRVLRLPQRSERVIALRAGMAAAGGDWIGWLASDDEYATHYLEVIQDAIDEYPDAMCFNFGAVVHHRYRDGERAKYGRTYVRETFRPAWLGDRHAEFKSGQIGAGSFVFRCSILGEIELLPEARTHVELHQMAEDVRHLYPLDGPTLGNPWGEDYLAFYRITRRYQSIPLDPALYIQHVRVGGCHDR